MRLTREQSEKNRRHIVDVASALFRKHGFAGVGVDELMSAAGFSHGGFYNHFASKDALMAEACGDAFSRANRLLGEKLDGGKVKPWRDFVDDYLSVTHRDAPSQNCTLAALAADAGRRGPDVQATFATCLTTITDILATYLAKVSGDETKPGLRAARQRAMQYWSELVGAMTLARSVAQADPALSEEILSATRRKLMK